MRHENYELIIRLQANDRSAFADLYKKYSHRIYLNALKLTKNTVAAQDIVQEVFITLWDKKHTLDPSKPLLNWIFVVSYNRSVDHLKRLLRTSLLPEFEYFGGGCGQLGEAPCLIREKRLELIERAVARLSPKKKQVFEICKIRGKTYAHAATEMQISRHTVKEYLSEAMRAIKTYVFETENSRERV